MTWTSKVRLDFITYVISKQLFFLAKILKFHAFTKSEIREMPTTKQAIGNKQFIIW